MDKYIVSVKSGYYNPLHDEINGKEAVVVDFQIGQRGWFVFKVDCPEVNKLDGITRPWHFIHTSIVKNIVEMDNKIVVTTENSTYTFERENKENDD